jgi:sugar phosphate isomerase/epimerase
MAEDLEGTLRRVAELGYDEVELAGLFGHDPQAVRQLLDELGLDPVASHVDWEIIREAPDRAIEETLALGSRYLVLAWMPPSERSTLERWRGWVDRLNDVARACRDRGLRFAYHNHDFEFQPLEGRLPFDLLLEGFDRDLVELEVDLYWLALAGREPGDLFDRYPGGYPLAHVKDMDRSDLSMADVGQGDLDFAATFAQADRAGLRHFFVEHDDTSDPWRTAEVSLKYLRDLTF